MCFLVMRLRGFGCFVLLFTDNIEIDKLCQDLVRSLENLLFGWLHRRDMPIQQVKYKKTLVMTALRDL